MADTKSWEIFRAICAVPYWEKQYAELFAPDCALDVPNAPPGMPQHFSPIERPIHFDWLERTTKNWEFPDLPCVKC